MPTPDSTVMPPTPTPPESMEPLLREHLRLRKDLSAAIEARLAAPATGPEVTRLDERCAGLLDRILSHLGGVSFEAMRRGIGPEVLEAEFDAIAGLRGGLDPGAPPGDGTRGLLDPAATVVWRTGAEAGMASSQYLHGMSLLLRPSGPEDVREAIDGLEKASRQDYAPAALAIARALESEKATPERTALVVDLLRAASDLGLAEASWRLAMRLGSGDGVPVDFAAALTLLEGAADSGHPEAQLELGRLRAAGGPGVEVDHAAALRWLSLAAGQHRALAREWVRKYGGMAPREYLNASWLDSWTPTELPPPPRSGALGLLVSLGLIGLLVAAALAGNSLGLFLLLVFVAILLHECGHWIVARMVGIPILVFSVGIGPLIRSFPWGRGRLPMRVDLRLLPLMGSVRPYVAPRGIWNFWQESARRDAAGKPPPPLPDFDRTEKPEPVFLHVPRGRRMAFLLGGLAVNLLCAVGFLWAYELASPTARSRTAPIAGRVPDGSIADRAGIREGDRFLSVGGSPVSGFFDVQRRLAPVDDSGAAAVAADPPGSRIPVVVRRGDAEVRLEWPTPASPPPGAARDAFGLFPPETWSIARVVPVRVPMVRPGDEILEFVAGGRRVRAGEPGAHAAFRDAFMAGTGASVPIVVSRAGGEPFSTSAGPDYDEVSGASRPPLEFERPRERVPARDPVSVFGAVLRFGWESVVGLPRAVFGSLRAAPTREEQGALLQSVRRDPWSAVRTFALVHAFLLFLNLVPIPPLDGFQVACCLMEMAAGRPLPERGVSVAMRIGWGVLALWVLLNAILILRDLASSVL